MSYDMLNIEYTELDNGCPALCICNEFIIPITSKAFPKNFIGFYDKELQFNINNMSTGKLKLKVLNIEQEIIELYYTNLLVGYIDMKTMYNVLTKCLITLCSMEE